MPKSGTFGAVLPPNLLAPIGLAIYLYQTRRWTHATLGLFAFIGGIVLIAILTVLVGDWLIQQGLFPPSFLRVS